MNHQDDSNRQQGLYRSEYEHDACGVGMVANLSGEASHEIVVSGMTVLKRLMHRGATGNDPETGDGAGLLMKIPHGFFRKVLAAKDAKTAKNEESFGVAMIFDGEREEEKIEAAIRAEGCEVLAWRDVPINPDAIGRDARSVMPRIRQVFIRTPDFGHKTSVADVRCRKSEVLSFDKLVDVDYKKAVNKGAAQEFDWKTGVLGYVESDEDFYGIILGGTKAVSNDKRDDLERAVMASAGYDTATVDGLLSDTVSFDKQDYTRLVPLFEARDINGRTGYVYELAGKGDYIVYTESYKDSAGNRVDATWTYFYGGASNTAYKALKDVTSTITTWPVGYTI